MGIAAGRTVETWKTSHPCRLFRKSLEKRALDSTVESSAMDKFALSRSDTSMSSVAAAANVRSSRSSETDWAARVVRTGK